MVTNSEFFKMAGACAGFLALAWNIFIYFSSKKGSLEVTLGWATNDDVSTFLYIDVVNKGSDARTIKYVSLVFLDEKPVKNSRHSTDSYVKNLPKMKLMRGEIGTEKILYQNHPYLQELFLNRRIFFRVTDTFNKSYDSNPLNDGLFELPEKSHQRRYIIEPKQS